MYGLTDKAKDVSKHISVALIEIFFETFIHLISPHHFVERTLKFQIILIIVQYTFFIPMY